MERRQPAQSLTGGSWDDDDGMKWLGAEASVRLGNGRGRRRSEGSLVGLAWIGLGFAAGLLAGILAAGPARTLFRRRRKS